MADISGCISEDYSPIARFTHKADHTIITLDKLIKMCQLLYHLGHSVLSYIYREREREKESSYRVLSILHGHCYKHDVATGNAAKNPVTRMAEMNQLLLNEKQLFVSLIKQTN